MRTTSLMIFCHVKTKAYRVWKLYLHELALPQAKTELVIWMSLALVR